MPAFHAMILSCFYGLLLLGKLYVFEVLTYFVGEKTLEVAGDLFVFLGAVGRGVVTRLSIVMGDVSWWHSLHSLGIPESLYISVVDYFFQRWYDILGWDIHISIAVAIQTFAEHADVNIRTVASSCIKPVHKILDSLAPGTISKTLGFFFPAALRNSHSNLNLVIPRPVHLARIRLEACPVWLLSMIAISSAGVLVFCVARSGAKEPEGSPCSKILDLLSNHSSMKASPASFRDGADASPDTLDIPITLPTNRAAETNPRTVLLGPLSDLNIGTPDDPNCTAARDSPDHIIGPIPSSLTDTPLVVSDTCFDTPLVPATTSTHLISCASDSAWLDGAPGGPVVIVAASLARSLTTPTPVACSCLSDLILKYQSSISPSDPAVPYPILGAGAANEPVSGLNTVVLVQGTLNAENIDLACQKDELNAPLAGLSTGGAEVLFNDSELCPRPSDPLRDIILKTSATHLEAVDALDHLAVGVEQELPYSQQNAKGDPGDQEEWRISDGITQELHARDPNPQVHVNWSTGQHAEEPKDPKAHSNLPDKTADPFNTHPDASDMGATFEHSDTSEGESDLTCLSTQPSSTMSDLLTPPSKHWDAPFIDDDCSPSPSCYPADFTILAELPSETMEVSVSEEPHAVQTDEIALEQLFDAIHLRMFSRPRSARSASCQQPRLNPLATVFIPPKVASTKPVAPKARTISNSPTKANVSAERLHSSTANQPRTHRNTSQPTRKTHAQRRNPSTRDRSAASREQVPKYTSQKRPSRRLALNDLHKLLTTHTNQN